MNHGVKRPRYVPPQPEEVQREQRAKEAKRIAEYNAAVAELVQRKQARDYGRPALDLTTRVLELNPEFPSAWNYRRRILRDGLLKDLDDQAAQAILSADLDVTSLGLKRNPKNYSVWEHRKWILRMMPDPDWAFELKTVEKLLSQDARNFHGWDYRRHVVAACARAPPAPSWSLAKRPRVTTASELAYTKEKISSNFSNFSAWHYRSKLLGRLTDAERATGRADELELVRHAMWTDPNDQSAWLYHCWLIGDGDDVAVLQQELASIEELAEMEPDSRWCLEALARYKRLLLARHRPNDDELRQASFAACRSLRKLDPARNERYIYLESQIEAIPLVSAQCSS